MHYLSATPRKTANKTKNLYMVGELISKRRGHQGHHHKVADVILETAVGHNTTAYVGDVEGAGQEL